MIYPKNHILVCLAYKKNVQCKPKWKGEKSHITNNLDQSDYRSIGKRRTKQEQVNIEIIIYINLK
jgi:hypothetical protein